VPERILLSAMLKRIPEPVSALETSSAHLTASLIQTATGGAGSLALNPLQLARAASNLILISDIQFKGWSIP